MKNILILLSVALLRLVGTAQRMLIGVTPSWTTAANESFACNSNRDTITGISISVMVWQGVAS
jgi:hypothetical protein